MKTIIKNTITIFAIALTLLACSKSNDNPADSSGNGTFTCKIDGVAWTAVSASGGDSQFIKVTINARDASGNTMIFTLNDAEAKVGTLTLDGLNGSIVNYGKDTNYSFPSAGSINITTLTSTRAKGTFSFTLNDRRDNPVVKKIVTEGVFDVPLSNGF
jgi:Family of unknown function (DUF6252)